MLLLKNTLKLNRMMKLDSIAIVEQSLRLWSDKGNTVADWQDIEPNISRLLNHNRQLVSKASELNGDIIGFVKQDDKYFVSGNYIFEKNYSQTIWQAL